MRDMTGLINVSLRYGKNLHYYFVREKELPKKITQLLLKAGVFVNTLFLSLHLYMER
jgi:hypothetical protein